MNNVHWPSVPVIIADDGIMDVVVNGAVFRYNPHIERITKIRKNGTIANIWFADKNYTPEKFYHYVMQLVGYGY